MTTGRHEATASPQSIDNLARRHRRRQDGEGKDGCTITLDVNPRAAEEIRDAAGRSHRLEVSWGQPRAGAALPTETGYWLDCEPRDVGGEAPV
jgi:hypothetical protein